MSKGNFISNSRISKKYELTPVLEDDEYMDDYFRSVLSDFSADPVTKEDEVARKNTNVNGTLDRRYGRKSDNDIYKPDLFLGDMTPDPRSLMDSANLNGFRKHMETRKDALRINLLNDDDKSIHSATMTHNEVRQAKDKAFQRVKERYTNFTDQQENIRQGRTMTQEEIFKKKKSMSEYIINDNKREYAEGEVNNKHSNYQIKEFNKADNNSIYSIGKKNEEYSKNNNITRKEYKVNDVTWKKNRDGMNRVEDSFKKNTSSTVEKMNNNAFMKSKILSIENFVERKNESLDSEKLTGKGVGRETQTMSLHSKYINNPSMEHSKIAKNANYIENTLSDKKNTSNVSKFVQNRVQRNHEMASYFRGDIENISHKKDKFSDTSVIDNLTTNKKNGKSLDKIVDDIRDSLRVSLLSGTRVVDESKVNNSTNSEYKIIPTKLMSRLLSSNPDYVETKGKQQSISVFNYSTKKPEKFVALNSDIEIEVGKYGNTLVSKENFSSGSRNSKKDYKQIGLENSKMDSDMYEQKQTMKVAGSVGVIGTKFIRNKLETELADEDIDSVKEITSSRRSAFSSNHLKQ
jgi:hypothetical protein